MTTNEGWTEEDSATYRKLEKVAVPDRAEQIATLLTLLPLSRSAPSRVVDIGCGAGALSLAILNAFPRASVRGLDGSSTMRARAEAGAAVAGSRFETLSFELASTEWYPRLDHADAVVSSLALHHLAPGAKRHLFEAVARRGNPGGALLIADLVEPTSERHKELFSGAWTESVRLQAEAIDRPELYDAFEAERWNIYRHPDPMDQPSPLIDQLQWLTAAGFHADCYWLKGGHAIYGGYRAPIRTCEDGIGFTDALRLAREALIESEGN